MSDRADRPAHVPLVGEGPLVLVVEDNEGDARLALESLRESWGGSFDVTRVGRLEDARRALAGTRFGCVLLDLGLPDGRGIDVVSAVTRAAPETAVVVFTGDGEESLAVRALEHGAQDYLLKGRTDPKRLSQAVLFAIERKHGEGVLVHAATHDALTGLPTMTLFNDRLSMALARVSRSELRMAVLRVDLDGFDEPSDSVDTETGSLVLAACADRLSAVLRPVDTVAGLGGGGFVLLCEDIDDAAEASGLAGRLLEALRPGLTVDGRRIDVTASIGVVVCRDGKADPETIMQSAAGAMYQAKERGGDQHLVFDDGMHRSSRRYRETQTGLRRALPDELEVFYQPIVGAEDESVAGVEALVRWHHPDRGLLLPGEFLDVAMGTGMMPEINAWVLRQAAQQLATWQERIPGAQGLQMAVNLTPHDLREPQSAADITETIQACGVDPSCVVFELTESTLAEEVDQVAETVAALRRLGAVLSIDDFGAGSSSIDYVERFPVDVVKIDMSLIQSIGRDMRSEALCAAIIEMARALGLKAVAEGVETREQYRFLQGLGADFVQGYLFARPAPAEACEDVLVAGSTSRGRSRGPGSARLGMAHARTHASSR